MLLEAKQFKDFDDYVHVVIRSHKNLDISEIGAGNFQVDDDTVITLSGEGFSGSQFSDDIWEWPESLLPHLSRSARYINFSLPYKLRDFGGQDLLNTIKHAVLLAIILPIGKRKRLPSLRDIARVLNEYCFDMLTKANSKSFAELLPSTYEKLIEECDRGRAGFRRKLLAYLDNVRDYGRRGFLADYPGAEEVIEGDFAFSDEVGHGITEPLGAEGDEEPEGEENEESSRQFLPLSDEYIAQMGSRCVFYLDVIGPNLARLFSDYPDLPHRKARWMPKGRRNDGASTHRIKACRSAAWRAFLEKFDWLDPEGAPLRSMPFTCNELIFPPEKHMDVVRLVGRHMDALIHMLMLLSGGRASEVQSFRRDVITRPSSSKEGEDGFALVEGQTRKPSATSLGDDRNWPIPEIVLGWIANQTVLAKELGPSDSQSIWMGMSTSNQDVARVSMHHRCTQFAVRHGLENLVDGTAHPHRYRKSIARLALLALTGAPMLVMQMFGHRDLMTTLRYLLADPFIRDDLRDLLGERRIEIALNLVEDIDQAAGAAASTLKTARDAYFDEMKIPLNARSQKITLLQFVTARLIDGSVDIKVVYPGVICIRGLEQDGACAVKGVPIDPGRCQSRCKFRMDLALRKSEVSAIVEDCLDAYSQARDKQNPLVLSALAAIIIDNAEIYSDVHEHYLQDQRYLTVLSDCDD